MGIKVTDWTSFVFVRENLVQYWTGTTIALAIGLIVLFLIIFLALGVEFRYALVFLLPMVVAFGAAGWFNSVTGGSVTWVVNLFLLIVALIFGFAFWKAMT